MAGLAQKHWRHLRCWEDKTLDLDLTSFSRFTRTFKPDEIIFSEFEPGDKFYLIQSGRVQLIKNAGEHERTLDILYPSDMFGEMAILENSPRSATAIALDDVKVLELNAQNFEILMLGNPALAYNLLCIFAQRIYDSKRRFMILTLPDIPSKVADVFVILNESMTDVEKSFDRREFQITTEEVARWAGISVTQARDALSNFTLQKRLEIKPGKMVVKNINDFIRFVKSKRNQVIRDNE